VAEKADKARHTRDTTEPYRKPTPPPEDAEIESKYKPWTHLTEFERYKLRKKMKKNHTWVLSDIMIRRELADRGRGWENYYKAKAEAQIKGTKFIDIEFIEIDSVDRTSRSEAALAAQEAKLAARRL